MQCFLFSVYFINSQNPKGLNQIAVVLVWAKKDVQHYKQYVINNESPEDFLATIRNGTFS